MKLNITLKLFTVLLLLLFSSTITYAHTIQGSIVDSNNVPIANVYVNKKGSEIHTHTNGSGIFSIQNIEVGDELVFSHISYETQSVTITDPTIKIMIVMVPTSVNLESVVLSNNSNPYETKSQVILSLNPVRSSQELLQRVPGLFIGQHAGGGKAEQLFLRGFDIDHGTDVAIAVDGLPVNMVSHAHGQGYADLHFVIPETVNNLDYGKGSYDIGVGNFATAGHVSLNTFNAIYKGFVKTEIGAFDHQRIVALAPVLNSNFTNAYIATEYLKFDGPFDSPQNFDRVNLFGKLNYDNGDDERFNVSGSYLTSKWDASGQIPVRAVESGLIGRFGAIDDTEGGETSRANINLQYFKDISDTENVTGQLFYSKYDFLLYSNFTFFLEDPINGDQIRQFESRNTLGGQAVYKKDFQINGNESVFTLGGRLRNDRTTGSELSRTANRRDVLENIQLGDITETNLSAWTGLRYETGKWLLKGGLRLEYFDFEYQDALPITFRTQSQTATTLLPKLNIGYEANKNFNIYLNNGMGLHSNDTRVVLQNDADEILPRSFNTDLGILWKPIKNMVVDFALWHLYLEQEFVYVGDAGIVEPSGKSRRLGFDLGTTYQINQYVFLDANLNYARARAIDEPNGSDFIPLAPKWTSTGGIFIKKYKNFNASVNYRYIADRPANEDNSIIADGYTVVDMNLNYDISKRFNIGVAVNNLFDVDWNETQFATESRLQNETDSIEEIHFTPGTPFFLRGILQFNF